MSTGTAERSATTAAAGVWVTQAATAVANATDNLSAAAALWQTFSAWYDPVAIAAIARELGAQSLAGQEAVAAAMAEYVAQVVALLTGQTKVVVPKIPAPVIRNGTPMEVVHARPATAYRITYARTGSEEAARQAALERELLQIQTDVMLAARDAEHQAMQRLGVKRFRRVLRPELSATGSCLLCVAAATQVYTIEDLLPIHNRCKCRTMPIIDGNDPADEFNQEDLQRLYKEAGATLRQDLSNLRVQVNEHGELGPVLTVQGQNFTGPNDLRKATSRFAVDVDANRTTQQLRDTLAQLERSQARFPTAANQRRIDELKQKIAARSAA